MTRTYKGYLPLSPFDWRVVVIEPRQAIRSLPPRRGVADHSPDGFSWGYGGSGPAQLALAILCDAIGETRAMPLHQRFKRQWIETLDAQAGWEIPSADVLAWVAESEGTP